MKKILVIGGGSIGRRHTKNLLTLGEKDITIVEINPERAAGIQKELSVAVAPSLEGAFKEKKFDIALVCSPSIYHLEQALFCAERGCDLFIEKPLSHTAKGLNKIEKMTEKKKLITMVGSNWKFYPLFQKMKELIDAGAIGRLLSVRCQFGLYLPDWHPWEDYRQGYSANKKLGGGILLDSHEFDYLPWFVGSMVKKVACFADKVSSLEIDVEDTAEVIMQFENKVIGEIHLDYTQRFHQRNFEFFGENGTIIWDAGQKQVTLRVAGKEEERFLLPEGYEVNQMYVEEVKHFLECIRSRHESLTPVLIGATVVGLIAAAKSSAAKGKVVYII